MRIGRERRSSSPATPRPGVAPRRVSSARWPSWTAALAAAGVLIGASLARRTLRPVLDSIEQRERFLAAAAHELRTPVASLGAVCASARAGDEPPDEALDRIAGLVEGMTGEVEQLLLFARLDAGPGLDRKPVRLDLLAEAALPEEGVELHASETVIEADPALVEVAVRNLVENARTHGAPPIQVTVGDGRVSIDDAGPGIDPELRTRATEPFEKSPASTGAGLGLAIVHLVAELHGGALRLEDRPGGGTRAVLDLS